MTSTPPRLPGTGGLPGQLHDLDPSETQEWMESLDQVVDHAGRNRARCLILSVLRPARERRVGVANLRNTDYINTIPPEAEPWFPGDEYVERRIRAYIRWNAAMMVHRAQQPGIGVGGHISTYASAAALYEVGFNHFFRGHDSDGGGYARTVRNKPLALPTDLAYAVARRGSGRQEVATTMAFVRLLKDLMKDPEVGHRFVPIIPNEARTFGLDSLFSSKKIYSPHGQNYVSADRELMLSYQEDRQGVLLHEGITEAGSVASWTAAGTSYATHGEPMIPICIFYSMFGFQRTGNGLWAAADQMTRGFLLGATAGRTTLNGEGLQHQDGHSPLLASANPACLAYDAAYAFELGHIVADALRRMYGEGRDGEDPNVFYYLTLYNEPITQPAEPEDVDAEGILAGMHRYSPAAYGSGPRAQILASGIAVPWALEARRLLRRDWGVRADVWSVTSWTQLRREALATDEWNLTHPDQPRRVAYVTGQLQEAPGPVVAVSDWMRAVPDQIAPFVPGRWSSLGPDGFGRSDNRTALRRHFEVDASSIVLRVVEQLVSSGELDGTAPTEAIRANRLGDGR